MEGGSHINFARPEGKQDIIPERAVGERAASPEAATNKPKPSCTASFCTTSAKEGEQDTAPESQLVSVASPKA